jgi:hypothetical protein
VIESRATGDSQKPRKGLIQHGAERRHLQSPIRATSFDERVTASPQLKKADMGQQTGLLHR